MQLNEFTMKGGILLRHNAQMLYIYTSKKLFRKHKFPIKNDNSLDKV